jgi:hypothetical protein
VIKSQDDLPEKVVAIGGTGGGQGRAAALLFARGGGSVTESKGASNNLIE